MPRNVIVSGLLGGVVLVVWGFVVNGSFRQAQDKHSRRPRYECPCGFCLPRVL
jgi:hypothetical protein